jgi:hypothetical protein
MSEHRQLSASEVRNSIMRCFAVKRPAFIWGPPGIGKSELVEGICKDLGGAMYDLRLGQMEPTDIRGIPYYNKDDAVMDWAQPIDLPQAEQLVIDAVESGQIDFEAETGTKIKNLPVVVLFLDEMNSAPPSVLAAAYQLILNRRIGKYKLPDNVVMLAAGNRESDKGVTFRMPTPLANRFVHFEMKVSFDDWFLWAVENNVHKDIVGYLNFAKKDLYDFDPKSASRAFATPRSWVFVSDLIADDGLTNDTVTDLVAGTVGEGLALKFMAHRKVAGRMPNPTDILEGKTKKMDVDEISAMYSLVVSMCYELKGAIENGVTDSEFHKMADNFFRFMMDNFETELVVMGARVALTTYKLPLMPTKLKHFDEFHRRYGKYIIGASD